MASGTSAVGNTNVVVADSDYLSSKSDATKKEDALGKDAFIQMLVTQMKYQDPLNPMDNQEMLAQLAQFTALEQMMNVAKSSDKQLANGMIGKYVEYQVEDETTGQTTSKYGKVDYVKLSGDTPTLGIGEEEVTLDKVSQVISSDNIQANTSAFEVIGKTIQATTTEKNEKGEEQNVIVEGEVKGIKMVSGKPYVLIGTGESQISVPYTNAINIIEKTSITNREAKASYIDAEGSKKEVTGIVDYIKILSDGTYVCINDQWINFNDVELIK